MGGEGAKARKEKEGTKDEATEGESHVSTELVMCHCVVKILLYNVIQIFWKVSFGLGSTLS